MVLVAFILSVLSGGMGSAGGSNSWKSGSKYNVSGATWSAAWICTIVLVVLVLLIIGMLLRIFLLDLLAAGCRGFFNHSLVKDPDLSDLGSVLREDYGNGVKICFLRSLYIGLWSLLFVIPGVVKSYEYRMVPYLLVENPHMSSREIFAKSREMMDGNKWDTFVLDLSFLGWIFLSGITCGILYIFWVAPYIYATDAALYRKLSGADNISFAGGETDYNFDSTGYGASENFSYGFEENASGETAQNPSSAETAPEKKQAERIFDQSYFSEKDQK